MHDPDALDADRAESEPTVGQLGRLDDLRDRADAEADVATTHLAPPLDEHHAELTVAGETVAGELRGSEARRRGAAGPGTGTAPMPSGNIGSVALNLLSVAAGPRSASPDTSG